MKTKLAIILSLVSGICLTTTTAFAESCNLNAVAGLEGNWSLTKGKGVSGLKVDIHGLTQDQASAIASIVAAGNNPPINPVVGQEEYGYSIYANFGLKPVITTTADSVTFTYSGVPTHNTVKLSSYSGSNLNIRMIGTILPNCQTPYLYIPITETITYQDGP